MTTGADQKTDWNLAETVMWICTRDHDRVAGLWEMEETDAIASVLFHPQLLSHFEGTVWISDLYERAAATRPAVLQRESEFAPVEEPSRVLSEQALQELIRSVQTRRVRMTMVRRDRNRPERSPVTASEANDLEIRLTGDPSEPSVVSSRSRRSLVGTSPCFSRADVLRSWPERRKKTAGAVGQILRHLREISTPEAPLTRAEALERCLVEVAGAYPEAVRKAWAQLEPARKRGRGKHGPRVISGW
jgi:hypothetical protein